MVDQREKIVAALELCHISVHLDQHTLQTSNRSFGFLCWSGGKLVFSELILTVRFNTADRLATYLRLAFGIEQLRLFDWLEGGIIYSSVLASVSEVAVCHSSFLKACKLSFLIGVHRKLVGYKTVRIVRSIAEVSPLGRLSLVLRKLYRLLMSGHLIISSMRRWRPNFSEHLASCLRIATCVDLGIWQYFLP